MLPYADVCADVISAPTSFVQGPIVLSADGR